jgi:hypothetical protein
MCLSYKNFIVKNDRLLINTNLPQLELILLTKTLKVPESKISNTKYK